MVLFDVLMGRRKEGEKRRGRGILYFCPLTHRFKRSHARTLTAIPIHPHSPPLQKHLQIKPYILSSLHLDLTRCHPSISPFPPLFSNPNPLSTHSRLPISLSLLSALANANRSSSPLNILLFFSMFMFMPRSSIRLRITSETASGSDGVEGSCAAEEWTAAESSDGERKRDVRGTAVVRTSLAWLRISKRYSPSSVVNSASLRQSTYPRLINRIYKRNKPPRQIPRPVIHARHALHNKRLVIARQL